VSFAAIFFLENALFVPGLVKTDMSPLSEDEPATIPFFAFHDGLQRKQTSQPAAFVNPPRLSIRRVCQPAAVFVVIR